jgi:DNA-binding MltR family transcriptional regulator
MAKHVPPKIEDFDNDEEEWKALLNETSEHTAIIVGASYIDATLTVLLHRYMIESSVSDEMLDPVKGPLGSFNAKANMCYVLGLISKEHLQDVIAIANMRNYCAHTRGIKSFKDPKILASFEKIKYLERVGDGSLATLGWYDAFTRFKQTRREGQV